jgi:drug/metabolite transporter (DMT)-like permease
MSRLAILDPTKTGGQAEDLDNKVRQFVVGQGEAIHQIVRAHQTHLTGLSPLKEKLRTALFVAIVVCGNLVGNILVRVGMRSSTALPALVPMAYLHALLNPWVLVGVLLLIVGIAAQLALLSWADLSYVAPVTSIGYVLTALAGELFLHEPLSKPRWAAIFLISAGVVLVSKTPPSTARGECVGALR